MKVLEFTKMQGSGNDFVVVQMPDSRIPAPKDIRMICDRIYGIGADGLLVLGNSKKADAQMRIFNADGTEAEMCGNGARCAVLYLALSGKQPKSGGRQKNMALETKAGVISAQIAGEDVRIKLTDPEDLKLGLKLKVKGAEYEVDYLNTGVPHAVIEVDELDDMPVKQLGNALRHHEAFKPKGANINFIKILNKNNVLVRTYERGVEDETLACGTGSVAAAIITVLNCGGESFGKIGRPHKVMVKTKGGEKLAVYFKVSKKKISDVWLEGRARVIFKGEYFL